MHNNNFLS